MSAIPCALLKDLRSTGYFFNELKSYSESRKWTFLDMQRFCNSILVRTSDSYDRSGKSDKENFKACNPESVKD